MNLFRLDNKVALVTGAARGLGLATTRILAGQGARVAAADVLMDEMQEIATAIGPEVKAYDADVGKVAELRALVNAVIRDFGRIDILVNNAAICPRLSFMDSTEADWERLMDINARSQFFLTQAVCPIMKKQGGGRIINVLSTSARIGAVADASIYSGTKGAMAMITKSVAREVAADGILVNCVAPGTMETDLMRNLPPKRVQAICEQIPLNRMGKPEEVAMCIVFLASDECSYCTGATFDINGGWAML
jgi:NAD(P)-dependent dehydrogenase (short-subunit alcohol dehydrogenase family)